MSEWRKEASRRLPELWRDERARETPNLFFELVPFVREAHRAGDDDALRRAYDFALWCYREGNDLRNAAGVSFYEHLFDSWDVHEEVLRWLDPQVGRECWPLYEARLDADKLKVLRTRLQR